MLIEFLTSIIKKTANTFCLNNSIKKNDELTEIVIDPSFNNFTENEINSLLDFTNNINISNRYYIQWEQHIVNIYKKDNLMSCHISKVTKPKNGFLKRKYLINININRTNESKIVNTISELNDAIICFNIYCIINQV